VDKIFFNGWEGLLRTLVIGVLAYIVLVAFVRISGKRALSKLSAFDLVVTVALGSTLASMLLTKDVALAEGSLALALLIGLQFIVAWSSVRVGWIRDAVRSEPTLLLHRGVMLDESMKRERMTQGEVLTAIRSAGVRDVEAVEAVVLETDGSLSVVPRDGGGEATSLRDVSRREEDEAPTPRGSPRARA
jgi:uncharacterized membrane protein YcaP (DUF421 family)